MEDEEGATRPPAAQEGSSSAPPPPATPSTANPYSPASSQTAFRSPPTTTTPFTPVAANAPGPQVAATQLASTTPPAEAPHLMAAHSASNTNPRQRSSIACLHCRKSKIRCVNEGIDTQCNACRHAGRECKYSVEMFKRSRVGEEDHDRNNKRTKNRKSEGSGAESGMRVIKLEPGGAPDPRQTAGVREDALNLVEDGILDPSLLTPQVWSELYTIFETNFGTDFPFLHSPTFSKRLREAPDLHPPNNASLEQRKAYEPERVPGWEILVLGILALTARFHPRLVEAYCSGKGKTKDRDPSYASEHFATILRAMLVGSGGSYIGIPNVAKIQTLLMLGMYEWSSCKGGKAWIHVGIAIRMAQAVGLQFEDDSDFQPLALSSATRIDALHLELGDPSARGVPLDPTSGHAFIEEEMRRRTFWSCFVMDRYLSSGKFRPSMLMLYDIRLQLPCSQNAFLFGDRVCTEYIDGTCSKAGERLRGKAQDYRRWMKRTKGATEERGLVRDVSRGAGFRSDSDVEVQVSCETGSAESVLSVHVRMVEIWGRIAKWSCAGGIRSERYAPWHPSSEFHHLRDALTRFQNTLPRLFRLSKTNIDAHIAQRTTDAYVLLQVFYSLSVIVLHRELLPFVPVRCTSPQGPMDQSQFPHEPPMPHGFYAESARNLFGASRDILDLTQSIRSQCPLPETPMTAFGLYTMAFTAIYALHFPHMDPTHYISTADPSAAAGIIGAVSIVLEMIADMRRRLPMADNWFRTIHRVHRYYDKISEEAIADSKANPRPSGLPVHHLPSPGQLEGLRVLFKRYGLPQDDDVETWAGAHEHAKLVANGIEESKHGDSWHAHPVNHAGPDHGPRPTSSGQRYGPEANHYVSTPPYSLPQPPGLSRGSTPTPSASSTSPYQGPSRSTPYENQESHPHPPLLHQQLAHAAANATQPDWQHARSHPHSRFNPLPLPTPSSSSSALPNSVHYEPVRPRSPFWMPDLEKALGGDDVAAFMDGMSCQDWAESLGVVHSTWGVKGGGWKGLIDGEERGWLGRVWRGSSSIS